MAQSASSESWQYPRLDTLSKLQLQMTRDVSFDLNPFLLPRLRELCINNFLFSHEADKLRVCNVACLNITHTLDPIMSPYSICPLLQACHSLNELRISPRGKNGL